MNKIAIKNFAIWARNKLIADVSYKAGLMGITKDGIADALSQSTADVEFYDIGTAEPFAIRGEEIKQRRGLVQIIKQKERESDYVTAYNSVIEEVAYTWFNRLIAVRFMEVNDYMPSHVRVLSSETGKLEPDLVTTPFDAELDFSDAEKQQIIQLKNDNKLDDTFRMLFIKQCNALHEMLPRLFENTSDYSELLLNVSFVDQEGVVYHLVHDIDEDDFNIEKGGQVEIIGWLYQYYNAELKDETFALLKNNVKVTKERIPSATQLFTPDWIVRYMVENSLGRLWVEGHPNDILKSGWKYYLDEAEQEAEVKAQLEEIRKEYAKLTPEDIKVIDPCMGSGHILVYAFDVLIQIYESAGYTQRDAAKSILENNLFGLDIDERAAQLAYFAVLMKARQYNRKILNGETDCNVYAIKESNSFDREALVKLGDDLRPVAEKLLDAFAGAREYGSIIEVDVTLDELNALAKRLDDVDRMSEYGNLLDMMYAGILCTELDPIIKQAGVLVQKYDAVVTNPPYMGSNNMNRILDAYVKKRYPDSKSDLSTVFMERSLSFCKKNGYYAMINIPVWMFTSSFEKLRKKIIDDSLVISLVHYGRGVFGADFGTVSFTVRKTKLHDYKGCYKRLFEKQGSVDSVEQKEQWFFEKKNYYAKQDRYSNIPGYPIAYWVSDNFDSIFNKRLTLADISFPKQGLHTGNNDMYLRCWYEVHFPQINTMEQEEWNYEYKWAKLNKGGDYRKWYGNRQYVLQWEDNGKDIKGNGHSVGANNKTFFKNIIGFTDVTSYKPSFRLYGKGFIFDVAGPSIPNDGIIISDEYLLALLNSRVTEEAMQILSPTIHLNQTALSRMTMDNDEHYREIEEIARQNIEISRNDWDSFETSWDFKRHPLV